MSDIITSIVTAGVNNHATVSEEANSLPTDLITAGVVGTIGNTGGVSPATGSYAINQSGTPAMTVDITLGRAYITCVPSGQASQSLRARMAANTTAFVINANATGSTRYDWVYLKADATKAAAPSASANDVVSIYVSRSTSNTSDNGTPPTYGLVLAVITVANGATSIVNANITDKRINITTVAPGFVTNESLSTTAGDIGGAWKAWTPTFTNMAGGTLTEALYTQIGKTVFYRFLYTTSGANISGSVSFSPPITAKAYGGVSVDQQVGTVKYTDTGVSEPYGAVVLDTTTKFKLVVFTAGGAYVYNSNLSSIIPFTWGNGDIIAVSGFYQVA
jgi:hypothetical protein